MKKYLQITLVLAVFLAIVLLHDLYGGGYKAATQSSMINPGISSSPTPIASNPLEAKITNTPTPAPPNTVSTPGSAASVTSTPGPDGSTAQTQPATSAPPPAPQGQYKDGTYTGLPADAFYGTVQVQAIVANGKLVNVKFLQYPNDARTSRMINSQAMPWLIQEAVQAQNANVDIISGASATSYGFTQSLSSALSQAQ